MEKSKGRGIFVLRRMVGPRGVGAHCKYQPSGRER